MKIKSILFAMAFLMLLTPAASQATFVTVSWSGGNDIGTYGSGMFSGHDTANNGIVTFDTLDSFLSLPWQNLEGVLINMDNLSGFGSFDINANTWIPDGNGWTNEVDNAWFTWNNDENSINLFNTGYEDMTWQILAIDRQREVAEPGTLALFAVTLFGFLLLSGRKKADFLPHKYF